MNPVSHGASSHVHIDVDTVQATIDRGNVSQPQTEAMPDLDVVHIPPQAPTGISTIPSETLRDLAQYLDLQSYSFLRSSRQSFQSHLPARVSPSLYFWVFATDEHHKQSMAHLRDFRRTLKRVDTVVAIRELNIHISVPNQEDTTMIGSSSNYHPSTTRAVACTLWTLIPRLPRLEILGLTIDCRAYNVLNINQLASYRLLKYLTVKFPDDHKPRPLILILNQHAIDLTRPRHWLWVKGKKRILHNDWLPNILPLDIPMYCRVGRVFFPNGDQGKYDEGFYYIYWSGHYWNLGNWDERPGLNVVSLETPSVSEWLMPGCGDYF